MNNGKICISLCAKTSTELAEKARTASALADVLELRLDCLDDSELEHLDLPTEKALILTFRPREQGGARIISREERIKFWSTIDSRYGVDIEEDMIDIASPAGFQPAIVSFHDLNGQQSDISQVYGRLAERAPDIVKVAVRADDACDAINVWNLLQRSEDGGRRLIPIAMGEAGKWTRILGLAHGAYLTYASLESGGETAPGQISAEDMINVFRVKELDRATDVYGIIAGNTTYTMSPYIHNAAFSAPGLNSVFVPLQVADLNEFIHRMVRPDTREVELNFHGFSVTNPHKQTIIKHLDELDDAAHAIGAVNTIKVDDGKLYGHNTDAPGFIKPLKAKLGDLAGSRVTVFGAGGAARAVVYSLKKERAEVTVHARDVNKAMALAEEFDVAVEQLPTDGASVVADIVVNATPLGTKGEFVNETVATADQLGNVKLVYDLVYNPSETRLLKEAIAAGADTLGGFDMLIAQAVDQFELWTGTSAPLEEMTAAARKRLA